MYRHKDYVDAIRFVQEGKIQLKPLISKHFAFKEYIDENRETTMKVKEYDRFIEGILKLRKRRHPSGCRLCSNYFSVTCRPFTSTE